MTWLWYGSIGISGQQLARERVRGDDDAACADASLGGRHVVAELEHRQPRVQLGAARDRALEQAARVLERVVAAVVRQEARAVARDEAELRAHPLRRPQLDARAVALDERRLLEQAALDLLVVRDEEPARGAVVALDRLALDELAHAPPVAQRQPQHRRRLPLGLCRTPPTSRRNFARSATSPR